MKPTTEDPIVTGMRAVNITLLLVMLGAIAFNLYVYRDLHNQKSQAVVEIEYRVDLLSERVSKIEEQE